MEVSQTSLSYFIIFTDPVCHILKFSSEDRDVQHGSSSQNSHGICHKHWSSLDVPLTQIPAKPLRIKVLVTHGVPSGPHTQAVQTLA